MLKGWLVNHSFLHSFSLSIKNFSAKSRMYNWSEFSPLKTGVLMGIQPRTFLSSTGQCTNGELTPYYMNWGIQLGSGSDFPEQAMVIVQTFKKTDPSAPNILYGASELPAIYFGNGFAQSAWYMPNQSFIFVPAPVIDQFCCLSKSCLDRSNISYGE